VFVSPAAASGGKEGFDRLVGVLLVLGGGVGACAAEDSVGGVGSAGLKNGPRSASPFSALASLTPFRVASELRRV